jgi:DNA polymerase lambda
MEAREDNFFLRLNRFVEVCGGGTSKRPAPLPPLPPSKSTKAEASSAASSAVAVLPDLSRNGWVGTKKDKWACQKPPAERTAPANNLFLADEFDKLAAKYKAISGARDEHQWRHFTYSKCAKMLRGLGWEVTDASQLQSVRGFGESVIKKVDELLRNGEMSRLRMLSECDSVKAIEELCKVHGVGPKTAQAWREQGVTTIEQAKARGLMNAQQLIGAKHVDDLQLRIPREEVTEIIATVRRALDGVLRREGVAPGKEEQACEAIGAGSYRRGKPSSGDVDVLICRRDGGADTHLLSAVLAQLAEAGCSLDHLTHQEEIAHGGIGHRKRIASCHSYHGIIRLPDYPHYRRLDLKVYPVEELAFALLYFTGSDHFNRSMRDYAKKRGYSLSDHGVVHATKVGNKNVVRGTVNLVEATTEEQIFEALGLTYVQPTERNCDVEPTFTPLSITLDAVRAPS